MTKRQWMAGALAAVALLAILSMLVSAALAAPGRQDPYPVATPTAQPLELPTGYPETAPGDALIPATIGAPAEGMPIIDAAAAATPASDGGRGLIYLWIGFIATLLIFLASVIGAMMLFNRRVGT